jgi:drug/metabolite transporter (DMT)-like permease
MGLKSSGASDVSLASSFSPIAGILAAYLILGEAPTMAQYIGGSLIIVGILLNQIGAVRLAAQTVPVPVSDSAKEMDLEVGFKGV